MKFAYAVMAAFLIAASLASGAPVAQGSADPELREALRTAAVMLGSSPIDSLLRSG
jgi:hypothetical protein